MLDIRLSSSCESFLLAVLVLFSDTDDDFSAEGTEDGSSQVFVGYSGLALSKLISYRTSNVDLPFWENALTPALDLFSYWPYSSLSEDLNESEDSSVIDWKLFKSPFLTNLSSSSRAYTEPGFSWP